MRSNYCGQLRKKDINSNVQLCGWVDRSRDHGGVIFIDLRDITGTIQITVDPDQGSELFSISESLRTETVIQIVGKVRSRPGESFNANDMITTLWEANDPHFDSTDVSILLSPQSGMEFELVGDNVPNSGEHTIISVSYTHLRAHET